MKRIVSLILSCLMLMSFAVSAAAASVTNEEELKAVLSDVASEFNATNGTTKDDVISYVQGKLPNATVWATNGNYSFKKRLATEDKAGFVNMGIGVTLDNVTTELFIFRQDIVPLSESQDAVNITADETAVKKAIDELSYNNDITQEDILKAAQNAATKGSTVAWEGDFYKKDATASAAGEVSGTIKLTLGSETRTVAFKKIIAKGNTGDGEESALSEDWYEIGHAMSLIEVTNDTTKEELMNAGLSAAKHGSTAEWTQFEIVKATDYAVGEIKGTFVVTLNGKSREHGYKKEIPKLSAKNTAGKIPTDISVTEEEWEVLRLINIERYKNGIRILTMPGTMQNSAHIRAKEQLESFGHTRPDGTSWASAFESGFKRTAIAENATRDAKTALKAVENWMNSEEHRKNLLTYDYNYTGIGNADKTHWVQMFAQSDRITSVTTSSGKASFASVEEMETEYLICTDLSGVVSYAPIDTESMAQNGNQYTVKLNSSTEIVLTVGGTNGNAPVFADVSADSYYADAVKWAVDKSITAGTSATTFSPDNTCTRAQILTFLWRAVGSPKASVKNPFADVKESDYFYDAAVWAYQNGMVTGTTFAGDTPCTRSATVIYLWKNAGSPETKPTNSFTDVSVSSEYAQAVAWAVNNNVTAGTSATTFSPDMTCTRGQIVTFLNRALK